jgi:hypothetical protein
VSQTTHHTILCQGKVIINALCYSFPPICQSHNITCHTNLFQLHFFPSGVHKFIFVIEINFSRSISLFEPLHSAPKGIAEISLLPGVVPIRLHFGSTPSSNQYIHYQRAWYLIFYSQFKNNPTEGAISRIISQCLLLIS